MSAKTEVLGGVAAKFVAMSETEAAKVALDYFGIDGAALRCAGEKDDTFKVAPTNGRPVILKVANPAGDLAEIDLQVHILEHLAVRAPSLPTPRAIANRLGERQFRHRDDAGQDRQIWMMSCVDGRPLSDVQSTPLNRQQIGQVLARLRLALADFSHPAESRFIPWDVKHLLSLQGLLGDIEEPSHRTRLEAGLARFASVERKLAAARTQVVHNDFTTLNILVDPNSPRFVSGVIDFGDATRTAIATDVATALLNQLPRRTGQLDLFAEGRDLLSGYLEVADLTEDELSLIPHLVMGRVITRALLSTAFAKADPQNAAYFLRNTEQGWRQLDWFLERSVAEVSGQFLDIPLNQSRPTAEAEELFQ